MLQGLLRCQPCISEDYVQNPVTKKSTKISKYTVFPPDSIK